MRFTIFPFFRGLLVCLVLTAGLPAGAQPSPGPSVETPAEKPSPLEVYFTTLTGVRYLQDDRLLSDRDLREIIFPLGDPEATRLLNKSRDSGTIGILGLGIGAVVITGGIIAATNNPNDENNVLTGLGVALGGACLSGLGALFTAEGNSSKFNSVQRFNQVVSQGQGQADQAAQPGGMKIPPIDVRLTTLSGFVYTLQGRELNRSRDFEERMEALNDFEALRLIKKSESSGLLSKVLLGLGIGGEIATILVNQGNPPGSDRVGFWVPLIGSLIVAEAGTYFQMESNTTKFNAVKRYNRFASGQEEVIPLVPREDQSILELIPPDKQASPKGVKPSLSSP